LRLRLAQHGTDVEVGSHTEARGDSGSPFGATVADGDEFRLGLAAQGGGVDLVFGAIAHKSSTTISGNHASTMGDDIFGLFLPSSLLGLLGF